MNRTNPALPSYVRPEAAAVDPDLVLIDDLLAGTRRMHERSSTYIRQWSAEDPKVYDLRRTCETVFGGFTRTLSAATGMLFAKPPAITWNASETAMLPQWDNIDGAGTKGTVFAKRFASASLRDGLGLLLIDHPPAPKDAQGKTIRITAANEARYNLRPRWAKYGRRAIINWQTGIVENRTTPILVVLAETGETPTEAFGITTAQRYRVLRLVLTPDGYQATWQVYEQIDEHGDKPESFKVVSAGVFRNRAGVIATMLPIAVAYTGDTEAAFTATIPLLGVAWANLAHWQIATNLRFNRDVCGFEQLVVTGDLQLDPVTQKPGSLKIGPLVGVHLLQGGTAAWIGPSGQGLAQLEAAKREKLTEMAQQGVSFLQADTRAAETAEAKRLDATAENSTLATAAQGVEDAINTALEIHAWYLGIDKAGAPVLAISRDYETTGMPPAMLLAWVRAIADAGIPEEWMLRAMQAGGLLPADADIDAIASDMAVTRLATEEQKRLDAMTRFGQPDAEDVPEDIAA